jgi:hypothetical protein
MSWLVLRIDPAMTYEWLKRLHYARRVPQINYAFGLYIDGDLKGVVTYGTPSSSTLRTGVAGVTNSHLVLELNRLCFDEPVKNGGSYLVSNSLRLLPSPAIVVSYADTAQGHVGYVYQACNFIYTGLSAKRTDWKVRGMEHLHGQTVADISKSAAGQGRGSRAQFMREKFGDDFYLEDRPRKHRYIYIVGNKHERKQLHGSLRYEVMPYPKGDSQRYSILHKPAKQALLELT